MTKLAVIASLLLATPVFACPGMGGMHDTMTPKTATKDKAPKADAPKADAPKAKEQPKADTAKAKEPAKKPDKVSSK